MKNTNKYDFSVNQIRRKLHPYESSTQKMQILIFIMPSDLFPKSYDYYNCNDQLLMIKFHFRSTNCQIVTYFDK